MMIGETILTGHSFRCDCNLSPSGGEGETRRERGLGITDQYSIPNPILMPQVLKSPAGWYIGTKCGNCHEHVSRESDYFATLGAASKALQFYEQAWIHTLLINVKSGESRANEREKKVYPITQYLIPNPSNVGRGICGDLPNMRCLEYMGPEPIERRKDGFGFDLHFGMDMKEDMKEKDPLDVQKEKMQKEIDAMEDKGPSGCYRVHCLMCGYVDLSIKEYIKQLNQPDSKWCCPKCAGFANFDDEFYDQHLAKMEANAPKEKIGKTEKEI